MGGGRRGAGGWRPPLNFAMATRTRVTMNAVKVVPKIMQRQLESFFSATRENAAISDSSFSLRTQEHVELA